MINKLQPTQYCGLALLFALLFGALSVTALTPYDIDTQDLTHKLLPPNSEHWLGTDQFGRDMLTRMASAIVLSFILGVMCVLTSTTLGVTLGVCAAWQGGRIAQGLDIAVNILLALPGLVLVLLFAAIAPGSFLMLYLAISMVQWVEYYRVSRAITGTLIHSTERQVSVMMGFGAWYQFRRHIWPTLMPSVLTMAAFGGANAILMMASLGFIAVGIQPPLAELGLMSVELFPYYNQAPWTLAQPLFAVALLVLGFHLLAGNKNDNAYPAQ